MKLATILLFLPILLGAQNDTFTTNPYYGSVSVGVGDPLSLFTDTIQVIKPGSLTIVHHDKNGSPYGTFCYTGRWAGEYFIARQNDTIAQVNLDSAMVFPRCCPVKYTR